MSKDYHSTPKQRQSPGKVRFNKLDLDHLDDIPQRDDSLGLLSIHGSELSFGLNSLTLGEQLQKEREKAEAAMKQLDALPDKYFIRNRTNASSGNSEHYLKSQSTISESDILLPETTSTPRESILSNIDVGVRDRPSFGAHITSISKSLLDGSLALKDVFNSVQKDNSYSFHSGESVLEQLEADELSWRRENVVPTQKSFSFDKFPESKMSLFFKQKASNLSELTGKSPEKKAPIALIELPDESIDQSVGISDIQQFLSDSKQTPSKAFDFFMNQQKAKKSDIKSDTELLDSWKENIDTSNISDSLSGRSTRSVANSTKISISSNQKDNNKSILSSRSSSTLSTLPDGKLPIESSRSEIIWGCIRIGKSVTTDFIVRNRTSSRLGMKCTISNPSFRLNDGSELSFTNTMNVILHPYESRQLSVVFAPTSIGAAADHLQFESIDPKHHRIQKKQFIKLCGYGGFGQITLSNVTKDTTGKLFLSLGNIHQESSMTRIVNLHNYGTLPGFVYIKVNSSNLSLHSAINVTPKVLVLLPNEDREIIITYTPTRNEINFIKHKITTSVFDLGKLEMTYGTEADRGRLRKVCAKATEKGIEINPTISKLVERFSEEIMPPDLKLLRESSASMEDLLQLFHTKEIALTLERDADNTIVPQLQDDTVFFNSLCETTVINKLEMTTTVESCQVEPKMIILTADKTTDIVLLSNLTKSPIYFETEVYPKGLILQPSDGTIEPDETCTISINLNKVVSEKTVFTCRILVDNEQFEVTVKVLPSVKKSL